MTATNMPTLEQLRIDSFMNQVSHSEKVVQLLHDDDPRAKEMIQAQLSHPDGIRGFFVTYLTGIGETPADRPTVPEALLAAMDDLPSQDLVPLAFMNVVMPTAMITMHRDENSSKESQKTAERGVRVLAALNRRPEVIQECDAILAVASNKNEYQDEDRFKFWTAFFDRWGYSDLQKRDIAQSIRSVLAA